ncbi:MAG TPA: hypothetical protein PLP33_27710 [Leptospiraceae bacterium]|nr:hypothetical protein [Leptospiraceae bacterium]
MKTKDLKELTEQIETERDSKWLSILRLYCPEIEVWKEEDSMTLESIVDRFVDFIKEKKLNSFTGNSYNPIDFSVEPKYRGFDR